jgi:hypothetical protein
MVAWRPALSESQQVTGDGLLNYPRTGLGSRRVPAHMSGRGGFSVSGTRYGERRGPEVNVTHDTGQRAFDVLLIKSAC